MINRIIKSADYLNRQGINKIDVVIILGTGLSSIIDNIDIIKSISYSEIPQFPSSTVKSHKGELVYFKMNNKYIVAMSGRFHYYEGYDFQEITFPLRVLFYMGAQMLIVSNAAGGVNENFEAGDIMIITDHINLMAGNPLRGKNIDELGERFPSMYEAYNKKYINLIDKIAKENSFELKHGVYCGFQGPSLETNAEYNMARIIGADAVGMSTVPEVIIARHMNVKVLGISVITNVNHKNKKDLVSHDDVIEIAKKNEKLLQLIIKEFIERA